MYKKNCSLSTTYNGEMTSKTAKITDGDITLEELFQVSTCL